MVLKLKEKKKLVLNIKNLFNKSLSVIVINYFNFTANEINDLRKNINKNGKNNVFMVMTRNSLLKLVVKNTIFESLGQFFINSTLLVFSVSVPGFASRLLKPYLNKYKSKLELKALFIENKLVPLSLNNKLSIFVSFDKALLYFVFLLKKISVVRLLNVLKLVSEKKKY